LIIRTLPNTLDKLSKDYSGSNPPYLHFEAMDFLLEQGVEHLLIDLPSVDREQDEGVLAAHNIFWGLNKPKEIQDRRKNCTITEMVYVDNEIEDGFYLLNLQIAPFPLDASPSKPMIYQLY
ncbi:MAG: cyclase family protein, partial [Bacteroidota bacterium]